MRVEDFSKLPLNSVDEASVVLERSGINVQLRLMLQLAVFAAVGLLLMLLAPEAPWSIRLIIIALVFLTLKRWGGMVVLLLVQADLYFRENQWNSALSGFIGVIFVLLVLMVLMFVARNQHLLRQAAGRSVVRLVRDLLQPPQSQKPATDPPASAPVAGRMLISACRSVTLLLCCVTGARILLSLLPGNRELTEHLRDVVDSDPSITMGAILIVAIVAFWVVASEISWRQMTAAQARVYLRSNFLKIHYRDLRMIVVRRLKQRMKRYANKKSVRKNAEPVSR